MYAILTCVNDVSSHERCIQRAGEFLTINLLSISGGPRRDRTDDPRIKSTLFPYPPLSCLVQ